jgi:hypothetical protein
LITTTALITLWRDHSIYEEQSVFIRSIFDASYGSASKLSRIDEIMAAFGEGRIAAYADVIALSH